MKHKILMRNEAKGLIVATAIERGKEIIVTNNLDALAECLAIDMQSPQLIDGLLAASLLARIQKQSILEISLVELLIEK